MKLDYGYDEGAVYAARMALMEGAYPSEDSRREFLSTPFASCEATLNSASAAMTDRFRMTLPEQAVNARSRRPKLSD